MTILMHWSESSKFAKTVRGWHSTQKERLRSDLIKPSQEKAREHLNTVNCHTEKRNSNWQLVRHWIPTSWGIPIHRDTQSSTGQGSERADGSVCCNLQTCWTSSGTSDQLSFRGPSHQDSSANLLAGKQTTCGGYLTYSKPQQLNCRCFPMQKQLNARIIKKPENLLFYVMYGY